MRRLAVWLLAATALLGALPGIAEARQPPAGGRSVTLAGRSPWVAPEGVLRIDLATEGDVGPLVAEVTIHSAVDSVEELADSLEGDTGSVLYRMDPLALGFVAAQADGTRRLEITTSPTQSGEFTARLRRPGVYPVTVTVTDETGATVTIIHTPVVRLGSEDDPLPAPDLAVLVEVVAGPTVDVDGRRDLSDVDLDRLERAAELIGAGGGRPLELTIGASPDTVDALTASADPRAADVLEALASTASDRTVVAAPYVPFDVPSLVAAGLGDFLPPALDAGRSVLDDRLGPPVDGTLWDSPGGVDGAAGALLASLGVRRVVVDARPSAAADSPAAERGLVDAGPVPLPAAGDLDALVVDAATSDALAAPATDRVDAGHIALAELLLRDAGDEATVAVRAGAVDDDSVLGRLLPLLADPASPIDVGPLDPGSGADDGAEDEDGDGVGPSEDEIAEVVPDPARPDLDDLRAVAPDIRFLSGSVGTFADLLGAESARADDLRLQLLTAMAEGIGAGRRQELVDAVAATIDSTFDGVSISGQTDLNLTSRRGTLPLMVRNDNPFPVEVVLRIRSDRLEFPEGDRFELVVGEDVARLDVPVIARATGSVPTFVEIVSPDGGVVLDSRRLDVRSTAVSGVGLAISIGALAVLVIWWARTWRRRRGERPEAS